MAEILVSVLLEQLLSITSELTIQKLKLMKDVKKDVSSLKSKLEAVHGVLEDAEKKQPDDAGVSRWLDKLKDVSYDMDNVLDEWSTEILKSKIDKQAEEEGENSLVSQQKVRLTSPSSWFCFTPFKQVGIHHEIACKLKELNEALDGIAKERRDYSLETAKALPNKRRETTSFVDESQVYGRDGDKGFVISKLLCESSHEGNKGPVIIPIVGMGGIGKTTLAQLVFNDDKVKTNFVERIWVCVSDPFDEIRIAKAILEALKISGQNLDTLEALLQRICESIEGKKFLLVLDDVWTDDLEKWEQLKQPLKYGAEGSRILITRRKKEVAFMMGVATKMICLELLSEEHCWLILSRLAFWERNSEECNQLEEIGRKIATKCKGLPLVARSLGSLMCFKETKKDWEDILSSKIWKLQHENIKLFTPFLLSYYDLPPLEKRCFSYCSVFPKDFVIDRDNLIEMWMSQGYLSSNENPEKEGRNCFKNLTMRSFFQDFEKDHDGSILKCKMHDILHDFAQFLTKNECVTMKVDEEKTQALSVVEKVHHSTLLLTPNCIDFPSSAFKKNNLHTLFIMCLDTSLGSGMMFFQQKSPPLRYLRMLNLRGCGIIKLPQQLGQLIHLRYLNLSDNPELTELPNEVCDLCNLQTLRLEECYRLQRLPEGMGKLVNLRHLHIGSGGRIEGLPKGITRLIHLRTLDTLVIPKQNEGAYLSLGDLKRLNHLQFESYFWISGCGNLKILRETEEAGLVNRENLVELCINFEKSIERSFEDSFWILEALQPHPSLKSLRIHNYEGINMSPKWMLSLVALRNLHLVGCNHCETLPPLGSLPSLEVLAISQMYNVRKIGGEFLGITNTSDMVSKEEDQVIVSFPKLKQLWISFLREWEEWEGNETTNIAGLITMPCLDFLEIYHCKSLKSLPEFLKVTPLKKLTIDGCDILLKSFQQSAEEWSKISHIPNIRIGYNDVKRDGIWVN